MNLDPTHALVVFSGGQDSTTCLGYALANYEKVSCLTFHYGQKHEAEVKAAENVVQFFRNSTDREIDHQFITLPPGTFAGTSPLTDPTQDLERYTDHSQMESVIGNRIEKTFVPMRNAVFLMLAANRAACLGAGVIITGVCEADNANYPDCRERFIEMVQGTIHEALGFDTPEQGITIDTPLINLRKDQSVLMALSLPHTYAALAWSHTAYDGSYPPTGNDHASVLRAHGFEKAGVPDPLILRAYQEGRLLDLPETSNYAVFRNAMFKAQEWTRRPEKEDD